MSSSLICPPTVWFTGLHGDIDAKIAKAYGYFLFHLVLDLTVALIAGREHIWLRHFFSDWCYDPAATSGNAFDTYVRAG